MKRSLSIFLAALAAFSFGAVALGENTFAAQQQAREASESQPEWIKVSSAQSLLNQELISRDGRRVGRTEAVMLNLVNGDAVFAIASPEDQGRKSEERMLIPFGALALRNWSQGPIQIEHAYDKIVHDSPRVTVDQLKDWMNRDRVAESHRRYGVPTPYGYVVPPDPNRERLPDRYLLVKPDRVPSSLSKNQQTDQTLADELRGAQVHKQNGEIVGEVEYVMLDLGSGRVAFVLVSKGNAWIPIPLQAFAWSSDKGLTVQGATSPDAFQPASKSGLPTRVQRSELEALYKRFDLRPYQEQSRLN